MKKEIELIHLEDMSVGISDEEITNKDWRFAIGARGDQIIRPEYHSDLDNHCSNVEKILFATKPLGELPVLVMPDESGEPRQKYIDSCNRAKAYDGISLIDNNLAYAHGYIHGYEDKANHNKWTDEEVIKLIEDAVVHFQHSQYTGGVRKYVFDKMLLLHPKSRAVMVEMEENQCDGCITGKPLNKYGSHIMGEGAYPDLMSCQKEKYNKIVTNSYNKIIITKEDLIY